jgi:mannose-6-phosphate isomerase-like protein (cupin superfamily)
MALAWDVIAATGLRNDDDEHERAIHRAPGSGAAPGPGHVPSLGAGDSGTDRWPGFGPPLHLHRDAAEAFFVLQGEYLMFLEDRQQLCPPGTSSTFRQARRTRSRSLRQCRAPNSICSVRRRSNRQLLEEAHHSRDMEPDVRGGLEPPILPFQLDRRPAPNPGAELVRDSFAGLAPVLPCFASGLADS